MCAVLCYEGRGGRPRGFLVNPPSRRALGPQPFEESLGALFLAAYLRRICMLESGTSLSIGWRLVVVEKDWGSLARTPRRARMYSVFRAWPAR